MAHVMHHGYKHPAKLSSSVYHNCRLESWVHTQFEQKSTAQSVCIMVASFPAPQQCKPSYQEIPSVHAPPVAEAAQTYENASHAHGTTGVEAGEAYALNHKVAISDCPHIGLLSSPMDAHCPAAEPAAVCPPPENSAGQGHPPQHLHDCWPPSWE